MEQKEHENLKCILWLPKIYYKREQSLRSVFGFVIATCSAMIFFIGYYALEPEPGR